MERAVGVVEWSLTGLRRQLWGGQGNVAETGGRVLCVVLYRALCGGRPHLNFTETELSSREDGWGTLETGDKPASQSLVIQRRKGGLG